MKKTKNRAIKTKRIGVKHLCIVEMMMTRIKRNFLKEGEVDISHKKRIKCKWW